VEGVVDSKGCLVGLEEKTRVRFEKQDGKSTHMKWFSISRDIDGWKHLGV
jgi:hypothetical protein